MRSLSANRVLAPLLVVMALAAVYGLTAYSHATTVGAGRQVLPPRSAAAMSVVRACPSLGLVGSAATDVALVAAPATAGRGQAVVSRLGGTAGNPALHSLTSPGSCLSGRSGRRPRASCGARRAARDAHRVR